MVMIMFSAAGCRGFASGRVHHEIPPVEFAGEIAAEESQSLNVERQSPQLDGPPSGPLTLPGDQSQPLSHSGTPLEGYPPLISAPPVTDQPLYNTCECQPFTLRQDLCELFPMLWDDTKSVVTWKNAVLLGVAAGGAIAIRKDADGDVREQTALHPQRWGEGTDVLRYFGEAEVQMPIMLGLYGISLWQQDEELHNFSKALIDAHAITSITTVTIKGLADTQRPDPDHYGGRWGFPSYHTSSSFAIAATIDEYYGWKAGLPAYAMAGLVGWSRIDGREHDLSDVVFGAALGYVIGKSVATAHIKRDSRVQIMPYYDPGQQTGGVILEAPY